MTANTRINVLADRRIVLGVTGSIAAYKAADLASKLTQAGASVDVVLTESACRFVSPLTYRSVTGRAAYIDEDLWTESLLHIRLGREADLVLVAPCTATTLSRLAVGSGDSLLPLLTLAADCPLLVAPAMDAGMYSHPATEANIKTLVGRGVTILGPTEGRMASGEMGLGRMVEPATILGHVRKALGADGPLAGRMVVVTAGGTREPIDPVRVIANRSSGKQGFAVAQAALDAGAQVRLITTPTCLQPPVGAEMLAVETAGEMRDAVLEASRAADILVMAAAVADFRPQGSKKQKIKRRHGTPELILEPTEDILQLALEQRQVSGKPDILVGFAAESENLIDHAQAKLKEKALSLLVANDISSEDAGFGVDTNRVVLLTQEVVEELPLLSKTDVAEAIIAHIVPLLDSGSS